MNYIFAPNILEIARTMAITLFTPATPTPAATEIKNLHQLFQKGNLEEAFALASRLSRKFPQHALAWAVMGNIHRSRGENRKAIPFLKKVVDLHPKEATAHFNLANTLRDLEHHADAAIHYQKALKLNPQLPKGFFHLGNSQYEMGLLFQAERSYQRALEHEPEHVETMNNLAHLLQDEGRFYEALQYYDRALSIDPKNATVHYNRADLLLVFGRVEEAETATRKAIDLAPNVAIHHAQLAYVFQTHGKLRKAVTTYLRALRRDPENTEIISNLIFVLNYIPTRTPKKGNKQVQRFGELCTQKAQDSASQWCEVAEPQRLRIGLVSGDIREHPVGYFLEGVVTQLDSSRIELVALNTQHFEDGLTRRMRPSFQQWHCISGLSDPAAAAMIRGLGLHIAVDLSGHTAGNRLPLFSHRLAPVQATWLGYPATTGLREMDYLIADPVSLPEELEPHFTESIWRLPETRLCFTPPAEPIPVNSLPAIENGFFTFGCTNNLLKINENVIALWGRIIRQMPHSRMLLQAKQLASQTIVDALRERFLRHGVAADQLIFQPPVARGEYLRTYHGIDLCLDPFPFPGGTTTAESLWMGVPVLTLNGPHFLGKQGASLIRNAGLPEWIAMDEADYENKAINFAKDLNYLATLRANLRQLVMTSPIFDSARFARNLESAFWGMWERRKVKKPAQ